MAQGTKRAQGPGSVQPRPQQKRTRVIYDDDFDDEELGSDRGRQHDSRYGYDARNSRGAGPRQESSDDFDEPVENEDENQEVEEIVEVIMTDRSPLGKLIRAIRASVPTAEEKLMLKPWKQAARFVPRCMGPFVNLFNVIICGVHFHGLSPEEWDTTHFKKLNVSDIPKNLQHYKMLLDLIPGLDETLQQSRGNETIVGYVAHFCEKHKKQARSDDGTKVKNCILSFLPKNVEDIPSIEQDHEKHTRGFHHLATARLLCPIALRGQFATNPQQFCDNTFEGGVEITAGHFPALLYREEGYWAETPEVDCLKSPVLSSVYRAIMTGPKTAKAPLAQSSKLRSGPGRKSVAKVYDVSVCTPETIAYVATLSRFGIDSQLEWCENDGEFVYRTFYENILGLFEDETWASEVVLWYNEEVFGAGHQDNTNRLMAGPSTMELIAARRRNAATTGPPRPQSPARQPAGEATSNAPVNNGATEAGTPGDTPDGASDATGSGANAGSGSPDAEERPAPA
ncbi:uncharacterized protein C8Q71DRAFT_720381 [Rhodofomes roseus]|uniref:Uncharacterized protein n=1 Tax=Rhodofomes roseus TaxID=34475 RepID=A0ABQ8KXH1_9APHY|nr:uncharacterized protein C8Q71DRAFT_720381 [Rhodofomes roseus]KAH9842995.1 hypothetical protein C8Q71DRAFT_720381 [Rhodofomes roseus]